MKPYVICHMVASIDGRILHSRWRPQTRDDGDLFERLQPQGAARTAFEGIGEGREIEKLWGVRTQSPFPRRPFPRREDLIDVEIAITADDDSAVLNI